MKGSYQGQISFVDPWHLICPCQSWLGSEAGGHICSSYFFYVCPSCVLHAADIPFFNLLSTHPGCLRVSLSRGWITWPAYWVLVTHFALLRWSENQWGADLAWTVGRGQGSNRSIDRETMCVLSYLWASWRQRQSMICQSFGKVGRMKDYSDECGIDNEGKRNNKTHPFFF